MTPFTSQEPQTLLDQASNESALSTSGWIWQADNTDQVRMISLFRLDLKAARASLKLSGMCGSFSCRASSSAASGTAARNCGAWPLRQVYDSQGSISSLEQDEPRW